MGAEIVLRSRVKISSSVGVLHLKGLADILPCIFLVSITVPGDLVNSPVVGVSEGEPGVA